MTTHAQIRLRFDPDLPLFAAKVKGHTIEIFFYGSKSEGKLWRLYFDADHYDFTDLNECWWKAQELLESTRKVQFIYPRDS